MAEILDGKALSKTIKEDLRSNQDKLKETLILANQDDISSSQKIKIAFDNIKLTKKVIKVFNFIWN